MGNIRRVVSPQAEHSTSGAVAKLQNLAVDEIDGLPRQLAHAELGALQVPQALHLTKTGQLCNRPSKKDAPEWGCGMLWGTLKPKS